MLFDCYIGETHIAQNIQKYSFKILLQINATFEVNIDRYMY